VERLLKDLAPLQDRVSGHRMIDVISLRWSAPVPSSAPAWCSLNELGSKCQAGDRHHGPFGML